MGQGRAVPDRTGQGQDRGRGKTGQGGEWQDRTGQDSGRDRSTPRGRAEQARDWPGQSKTGVGAEIGQVGQGREQDRAGQGRAGQGRTGHDGAGHSRAGQNWAGTGEGA